MENIKVKELISLIQDYKEGLKKQNQPEIIWFDKVEGDLLEFTPKGYYEDLAYTLSKKDEDIVVNDQTGSPLTDHNQIFDEKKNTIRNITEEERYSFILPPVLKFDAKGNISTKVYLHTSPTSYIGKKGLTSLEYSKMVHDKLHLPVLLFFPLRWREKLKKDIDGYKEYVCTDNTEDQKQRWLERVAKKSDDGLQIIDNFYLNFLKLAPNDLLSQDFDDSEEMVIGIVPLYRNWERISRGMKRLVKELISLQTDGDDKNILFDSLYSDGNLDFSKLSSFLSSIKDENWKEFIEDNLEFNHLKEYHYLKDQDNRLDIFKVIAASALGYFPREATKALLEFYCISPQDPKS